MKKLLIGVLSFAMVLSLGACSSSTNSSSSSTSASGSVSTSASSSDLITVGFAQVGHESDWRTAQTKSVQAALTKDNGFDLQFADCNNDSAKQLEAIRNFIQQQVDYIVVDPIVSTGWDTVLTEAKNAGIPVIVIDRTVDDSTNYSCWIGSEFTNEGLAAGTWLKDYLKAKNISNPNVLVIEGSKGSSAQIGRTNGFNTIAKANNWKVVDSQDGQFTQDGGQKIMESYCKSYTGKFNVVVCQNDNEAFGAIDAMDAAGVSYGVGKDVTLISFDASKAGLKDVLSGKINADFQCNPLQGPDLADTIKKLHAKQTVDQKKFMAEPWYVAENTLQNITYTNSTNSSATEKLIQVTQDIVNSDY